MKSQTETPAGPRDPVLDPHQLQEIEQALLRERDRTQEDLNTALEEEAQPQSASSGDLSKLPSHMADAASQADEADTDFRMAQRNSDHLTRIDVALRRLREHPEHFGVCRTCGEAIDLARLRIVPWTLRCARHAPDDDAS